MYSINYPLQWANKVTRSCSAEMGFQRQVEILQSALALIEVALAPSGQNLLARPTLMLFAHLTTALYLMEHAIWSHENRETDGEVHNITLVRWIDEGGMLPLMQQFEEGRYTKSDRLGSNSILVHGSKRVKGKL